MAAGALTLAAGHGLLLGGLSVGAGIGLLAPGLLLVGAGMGLRITPLTTIVLGSIDAQRAGAVSGTLSTMQQVGNSLGVAVTGAIFFGTLGASYTPAFAHGVAELACLLVMVALLSRLLPARRPA